VLRQLEQPLAAAAQWLLVESHEVSTWQVEAEVEVEVVVVIDLGDKRPRIISVEGNAQTTSGVELIVDEKHKRR
jgi:hypothetical protein